MIFDVLAVTIVLIFGFLGYLSGLQMQVMRLMVLIGSYFLSGALGSPLGVWVAGRFEIQVLVGQAMTTFVAFLLFYLLFSSIGWAILRVIRLNSLRSRGQRLAWWDASGGALFGGLKAAMFVYIASCLLVLVDRPLQNKPVLSGIGYDSSRLVEFTRANNIIVRLDVPAVSNLEVLVHLASDPEFRKKVAADPEVRALFEDPRLRKILNDPEITGASRSRDLSGLAQNPRLGEAMQDPSLRRLLEGIDLSKLNREPR